MNMTAAKGLRPYSKQELIAVAGQLGAVYRQGELDILRLLGQGSVTEWKRSFFERQLSQVQAIITGLNDASRLWADTHIPELYLHNLRVIGAVSGANVGMAAVHQEAILAISESIVRDLDFATGGVGRTFRDVYRAATLGRLQESTAMGETRREASRRIVAQLQEKGMTSFKDAAGREWALGDYAEMAARTTSREAAWQGTFNGMAEAGLDLVEISDHMEACPLCSPWEGRVVSLTGAVAGYPTLADAEAEGFGHPNCVHDLLPYVPEASGALE